MNHLDFFSAFGWLVFAHLLGDYVLQSEFVALNKGSNPFILCVHAALWSGAVMLAMTLLGLHPSVVVLLMLFSVHALADWLKANKKAWYAHVNTQTWGLVCDQAIHILQLVAALAMVGFL